ncbi:MAG: helix-turn-helix domain-containing protein, partial [Coriobacteriales bacterium]|nr:helix-turn-helix domain-containing protein [Coriobacteriales bacterium]
MRLKEFRESRRLSRREVAFALDVTEQTIFNVEKAQQMSIDLLQKLADFYGVSTDYILGRENTGGPPLMTPPLDPFSHGKATATWHDLQGFWGDYYQVCRSGRVRNK